MDPRCEKVRELAPELALGIVEGEERGSALEHLADCPECRRRVEELAHVADQLLLLAPHREAPVGFESQVLRRVLPSPSPRRRRRRRLALVLAPAAAALAAVAPAPCSATWARRVGCRSQSKRRTARIFERRSW